MYCRNCGNELPENSKFCNHCGTSQEVKSKADKSNEAYIVENRYESAMEKAKREKRERVAKKNHKNKDIVTKPVTAEHDDVIRCPKCNSTQITANAKGFSAGKAAAGVTLAGGLGLAAGGIGSKKVRITCLKCGHNWIAGDKINSTQEKGCGCVTGIMLLVLLLVIVMAIDTNSDSDNKVNEKTSTTTVVTTEAPDRFTAEEMIKAFRENEVNFDMKYDGKTIIVIGTVYEVDNESHIMSDDEQIVRLKTNDIYSLACHMEQTQKDTVATLKKGDKVKIIGKCSVYDSFVSIYNAEILE